MGIRAYPLPLSFSLSLDLGLAKDVSITNRAWDGGSTVWGKD